jgi:hypothetical protein
VKILKIFIILILSLLIVLFSASLILKDRVAGMILSSLNENLSTRVDVGSFRLSFLRRFPKASVQMKNVVVHSTKGFDNASIPGNKGDTLLKAKFVTADFSITDIVKGNYNIDRITARDGKANLFCSASGKINYEVTYKSSTKGSGDIAINLERINLTNINVYYNDLSDNVMLLGIVKSGRLKTKIYGDNIDFNTDAEIKVRKLQAQDFTISNDIEGKLDMTLMSSEKGIVFKKGSMKIRDYNLGISGMVDPGKSIDLIVTAHNFDISDIVFYLPKKLQGQVSQYKPEGNIAVNCMIKGPLTTSSSPHIEINWLLKKGRIAYGKSDLSINDLSFSGSYSNGSGNSTATGVVSLSNIKARLGSAEYAGSFSMTGFDTPHVYLDIKGKIIPSELKDFFALTDLEPVGGSAEMNVKIDAILNHKANYSIQDIIDLKPQAQFIFHNLTAGSVRKNLIIENIEGALSTGESINAENLQFIYKGQKIKISGAFVNLPEWIAGNPVRLRANASLEFRMFNPETFLSPQSDDLSSKHKAFLLPDDLDLDITFKIDSLKYKTFSSADFTGSLSYKPGLLTFNSFKMRSLRGVISGNGFLVQNNSKSFNSKGTFNVSRVDINKAFTSFNNFGQTFIKAENLKGLLSGSVSMILPLDSLLKPAIKSISAEGSFALEKGALVNFDPIKELSSFIELSELENISFDRMENDFFIRNNYFYIPQMDVKSSAANLSINGKHDFDNNYEYHIKMLLSEILSKKRKKNNTNVTEFGVVEDDGLGRTSLLLKVEGAGEVVKVGYDVKAAGSTLKNNIKKERQTLKTILNEEYGWYKGDSSAVKKPEAKKQRFRIQWDGNVNTEGEPEKSKSKTKGSAKIPSDQY